MFSVIVFISPTPTLTRILEWWGCIDIGEFFGEIFTSPPQAEMTECRLRDEIETLAEQLKTENRKVGRSFRALKLLPPPRISDW